MQNVLQFKEDHFGEVLNPRDEDEAADVGNGYLEISSLKERREGEAVATYRQQIINFSSEQV